jgi:hypothetical protein
VILKYLSLDDFSASPVLNAHNKQLNNQNRQAKQDQVDQQTVGHFNRQTLNND